MMPRARKKQASWSYTTGEKGANRVRVFVHRNGNLFVEYKRDGRKVRESLRHGDQQRGKEGADRLSADLRLPDRRVAIRLGELFDKYLCEVTPTKGMTAQKHDRTTLERFRSILGGTSLAEELTHRDAMRYESWRRGAGDLRPRRTKPGGGGPAQHFPIRARSISYDLRALKAVLTWGVGAGFLDRNPLAGYRVMEDATPRRPVFTQGQYEALLGIAGEFPWQFRCLLQLANETGHRLSAMLGLRWSDIDLTAGRITWREETDKIGHQHVTPITGKALGALEDARQQAPGIGTSLVLPGVTCRVGGISPSLARDWLERAQVLAGLPPEEGRGWHAFRRKFASELRDAPLRNLCDLGGWKDPMTVVKCYQRPSENAMRTAQANRRVYEG